MAMPMEVNDPERFVLIQHALQRAHTLLDADTIGSMPDRRKDAMEYVERARRWLAEME
jgi:hypothetical protein